MELDEQELTNVFTIIVGDDSGDGHRETVEISFACNRTAEEVETAYKKSHEKWPDTSPGTICSEFEDETISEDVYVQLCLLIPSLEDAFDTAYGGGYRVEPENMVELFCEYVCLSMPEFDFKLVKPNRLRFIDGMGYGLFRQ